MAIGISLLILVLYFISYQDLKDEYNKKDIKVQELEMRVKILEDKLKE